MYNKAIRVLNIFKKYGYQAYIVGGYPRDKILGIKTNDIDICTDAKPREIMEIFDTDGVSDVGYGSVRVIYKGVIFDVTTFRRDIKYENNRKPIKIKYVTDLYDYRLAKMEKLRTSYDKECALVEKYKQCLKNIPD